MNKVILMGRLTKDPEVRYTPNNVVYTRFTLAVNRRFSKDAEQKADFINVIAWNKTAEFVSMYFKKGQQVAVSGRLQVGSYDDKDGKRVWTTDVVAEDVYFADSKRDSYGDSPQPSNNSSNNSKDSVDFSDFNSDEFTIATDDDITF